MPALVAVEISAQWHGKMADVLCFGFNPHDQALRAITDQVRQKAATNALEVYDELLHRGYHFPQREALLTATNGDTEVAGDCATLLIKQGYIQDWPGALKMIRDAGYREMKADLAETIEAVHRGEVLPSGSSVCADGLIVIGGSFEPLL